MPTITVGSTVIDFPDSGSSPSWAPAVIAFAQAVSANLNAVAGAFDIPPQSQELTVMSETDSNILNLVFPTNSVRAAFIRYSVYRQTTTTKVTETGVITVVYNPDGPVNNKWEISPDFNGDASISFSITDTGQVRFSTTALGGTFQNGKIYFAAQSMLQ